MKRRNRSLARRSIGLAGLPNVTAALATTALISTALAGCASGTGAASSSSNSEPEPVSVFAAASLTDVLPQLEDAFTSSHPGAESVEFTENLAGSQTLVQHINEGAQPDVLITADAASIQALDNPDAFVNQGILATNQLVLAVPSDSDVMTSGDFLKMLSENPDTRVATCAPSVPCGRATETFLEEQNLNLTTVSEEADVRSVLSKVIAGEVDGGFVYATDAQSAGDSVKSVQLPDAPSNEYPVLTSRDAATAAKDFGTWLRGEQAQEILQDAGFETTSQRP